MKILTVHNLYQQKGGEDKVLASERALLESRGHAVCQHTRDNNELKQRNGFGVLTVAAATVWSFSSRAELRDILKTEQPNVAHFHNTFPLISPSAYYACAEAGVPVVQTLHNYRLVCPAATFLRDGKVCEECLGRAVPWPSVLHGCYRGSRPATLASTAMLSVHRALGTWRKEVNVYIALSEFARRQFIAGGLPADRVVVKPNFVADCSPRKTFGGEYALWVGRLSEEKGIRVLVAALGALSVRVPFRIAGTGPLFEETAAEFGRRGFKRADLLGDVLPWDVVELMHGARFVVVPSVCFENFPLVIAESFACGVPVIASRIGSLAEIVEDGRTGLHFTPGDAGDLAAKIEWAWTHPNEMEEMGRAARREYETKYTPEINYKRLMEIYERAIGNGNGHT